MMKVLFFSNGNTACFDEDGEQVASLQKSWFKTYLQYLEDHDIDPTEVEFTMPDGSIAKVFEVEDSGFNWSIKQ